MLFFWFPLSSSHLCRSQQRWSWWDLPRFRRTWRRRPPVPAWRVSFFVFHLTKWCDLVHSTLRCIKCAIASSFVVLQPAPASELAPVASLSLNGDGDFAALVTRRPHRDALPVTAAIETRDEIAHRSDSPLSACSASSSGPFYFSSRMLLAFSF